MQMKEVYKANCLQEANQLVLCICHFSFCWRFYSQTSKFIFGMHCHPYSMGFFSSNICNVFYFSLPKLLYVLLAFEPLPLLLNMRRGIFNFFWNVLIDFFISFLIKKSVFSNFFSLKT